MAHSACEMICLNLSGAHTKQIGRVSAYCHSSIDNSIVKLFHYKAKGRQPTLFDRAIIVTFERFPEYAVNFALHCGQFF